MRQPDQGCAELSKDPRRNEVLKDADPDYTEGMHDAIDGAELLGKAFGEDPLKILREKLPPRRGPGSAPTSARDVLDQRQHVIPMARRA